jgi:hypothetical protein
MTSDTLVLLAGAVLSLLFSYIPGLNTGFAALAPEVKRLIMAGLMLVVAAAAYGLSCAGVGASLGISLVCDQSGLLGLIRSLILAVVANQGAYAISPQTDAVKRASAG